MIQKTGVLLVNLGTPDSPNPRDVYRYLIQFLTDERVVDIPWFKRQCLVRGLIVPRRYRDSARSYAEIWKETGSPLLYYGQRVEQLLQEKLGDGYQVVLAMRYQNPSIESGLNALKECQDLVVLPLFPQYASASTGSVHQEVMRLISKWPIIPQLHFINSYPQETKMIETFCLNASKYPLDEYDHILLSFHGLPERQLIKADRHQYCLKSSSCCHSLNEKNAFCYAAQCFATAKAIREKLDISQDMATVCFQSRLGKEPWIQPFTTDILKQLAQQGKKKVLVFCPSFVADCLETTYEILVENCEEFLQLGGERLDLVESLNDHPLWIESLADMVRKDRDQEDIKDADVACVKHSNAGGVPCF